MKVLNITSTEALDVAVAEVVRLKIKHTEATAAKDSEVAGIEKDHTTKITALTEAIAELEGRVQEYCTAHREVLFPEKKSRETSLAVFGFGLTPHRVETASKKIHWKDVVARLLRLSWGKAYVRQPEPKPDKDALLTDREKLTPEQQTAAGIQFCQDEQFFIRPKPETAVATVMEAA
jgi:phage host-nuclease inhibitor protein Gam